MNPARPFAFVCAAIALTALGPSLALSATQTNPAEKKTTGPELAAELRSLQPSTNAHFSGLLRIRKAGGRLLEVPITCNILTGAPGWKVSYYTAGSDELPVERLTVTHFPDRPSQFLFARARNRNEPLEEKPLTADQLYAPLAGSDFWFLDLALDFFHWPEQKILKTETRRNRACYVLESVNPDPAAGRYALVRSWVDKETGGLLVAEAYDQNKNLLKEFSVRSFKKVDSIWQLQEMEIRDVISKSRTRIEFDL